MKTAVERGEATWLRRGSEATRTCPSEFRRKRCGLALLVMAVSMPTLAIPGWEGETFRPLAYYNDYTGLGPSPQSVCAAYANIWGWNRNGYSAQITNPTSNGWKCQRYYNGVLEPSWYAFVRGVARTSAGAPLQGGAPWSDPLADLVNDVFHCETGKRFDRSIQWCVPGSSATGVYSPNWDQSCPSSNPVYPASGNKVEVETDYSPGEFLDLRRSYSYRSNSSTTVLPVGPGWRFRLGTTLEFIGTAPNQVKVWSTTGGVTAFEKDQTSQWRATAGTRDRLVELLADGVRTGWHYYDLAQNVLNAYGPDGTLLATRQIGGAGVSFDYSDATTPTATAPWTGTLVRATSRFGRTIDSVSTLHGAAQAVIPGAQVNGTLGTSLSPIRYGYQEAASLGPGVSLAGQLTSVTFPDGSYRRYHYEDSRFPLALGGITESGARLSRYLYDADGRVTSTVWFSSPAVAVNQWLFTYTTEGQTTVVDPKGAPNHVSSINVNGVNLQTGSTQPAGSGCNAASASQVFDAGGNAIQRDDFNGNRTCRAFDVSRNLESVRVEGLAGSAACAELVAPGVALPAGSRKTSTLWHPVWAVASATAQPKLITTRVYNGQPDPFDGHAIAACAPPDAVLPDGAPIVVLCRRVEQATTDESGALGFAASLDLTAGSRTWAYTYNAEGQTLTSTDPRGSVTSYTYYTATASGYTRGDLQQVTNPLNQVTQFPLYNVHGQVLRSIDPNNVVTDYTYDLRQRLQSQTVAGQTTVYDYWPNGLIRQVTRPDSSHVTYEYDDARRLTAIGDNHGNRIEYTLDSFGTRIAERVKDPGGALRRQVARLPDALGRIQQVTGRE